MSMFQVGIIGIVGALLAVQLKGQKTEYGIYISIGVSLLLFSGIIEHLKAFVQTMERMNQYITIDTSYLKTMLKMIGISYISEFSSGICKDAGHQSIASQIEIFSKLSILALGMPVLLALLECIQEFLG